MKGTERYIINPNYILINDLCRVIITNAPNKDQNEIIPFENQFESRVHPFQAQMLSFFDGEHTLKDVIGSISSHFGIFEGDIETIIEPYIENSKTLFLSHGKYATVFPKNMIIPKKNIQNYRKYSVRDFLIDSELDFKSKRYYIPRYFLFVLNTNCYTNCRYCYADKKHKITRPLSTEKILRIIDEIQTLGGAINIDCNGGEVLMHPDIFIILKHLTNAGYYPLISTKLPLSKKQVQQIKASGIRQVQFSLDTSNKTALRQILQIKMEDYYDRILDSITWLCDEKIDVQIHSVITSQSADIEAFENMIQDTIIKRGAKKLLLTPAGYSLFKSCQDYAQIKPQVGQLNLLHELIIQYQEAYPDKDISIESPGFLKSDYQNSERRKKMFDDRLHCGGNKSSMVILPDGKVTICEEMYWHPEFILGDLSTQSIMEVWNSDKSLKLYNFSQKDVSEKSACKTCQTFEECRGVGKALCWKYVQYFYGRENWDFPYPSCEFAPEAYQDCLT